MPETRTHHTDSPRGFAHNLLVVLLACVSFSIGAAGATGLSSALRALHDDDSAIGKVHITNAEFHKRRDALAALAR